MSKPHSLDDDVERTAHAVTELALSSLRPSALRWEKSLNLALAQLAWNAGREGEPPLATDDGPLARDRALAGLLRTLLRERRRKFRHLQCMVFDLDVHTEGEDIVFTFSLSWDGGEHRRPCEMTLDQQVPTRPLG